MGEGDHRSRTLETASCCQPSLKRSSFVAVAKGGRHLRRLSRVPTVFDEEVTDSALLCLSLSNSSQFWEDSLSFLAGPFCFTVQPSLLFSFLLFSCHLMSGLVARLENRSARSLLFISECFGHRHGHLHWPLAVPMAAYFPSSDNTSNAIA